MLTKTIVFAALVGFSFTVNTPALAIEGGYCQTHKHKGSGRGPTKSIAKLSARQYWRFNVLKHGHPQKILWSVSKDRRTTCNKKYYGYKCWAEATPCFPYLGKPVTDKRERYTVEKGVNLDPWCKKNYGSNFKAKLIGKTAGDWTCERSAGDRRPISVADACKLQYGKRAYKAKALNWNDPYSWKCLLLYRR